MRTENLKIAAIALGIFALNMVLKGIYLGSNSLAWDEPFSVYHAQLDVGTIVERLAPGNNPPFYEIFLHGWIKLFGIGEFAVRFPSLLFNAVTAVLIFVAGHRYFNLRTGIFAALIFTFSNYQVFFAHEARVYALFEMLAMFSMLVFMEIGRQKKFGARSIFALLVINSIMLYSHYFGFFIVILQTMILFSFAELRKPTGRNYLLYLVLLIVLYLPMISVVFERFVVSATGGTWIQSPTGISELYEMLRRFTNAPVVTVAALILLAATGTKLLVQRKTVPVSFSLQLILIWFFVPFIVMFLVSFRVPMFIDRYLIFLAPAICLILAVFAGHVSANRKIAIALQAVIVVLFIVTVKPNIDNRRHVKEALSKIEELKSHRTKVIFCPHSFVFNFVYYYDKEIFRSIEPGDSYTGINRALIEENIQGIDHISEFETGEWSHVVYLDAGADFSSPGNGIANHLKGNFNADATYEFEEIFAVYSFSRKVLNLDSLQLP